MLKLFCKQGLSPWLGLCAGPWILGPHYGAGSLRHDLVG